MKITEIRLGMLRVPLKTPFKTALRTVDTVEDIVVEVHTDTGHVGYGEAAPTAVITGDTHGSIVEAIRRVIGPRLVGREVADLNRNVALVQSAMERNTSAKAAVEIALYDLFGQLYGAPLYRMLGGGGDPVVTTDITISVDYIDKMVADSLAAVERGFESLKIKVGKDIGVDIERVKAIHAKIKNQRKDALHKFSTTMVQQNAAIFVGDVASAKLVKTNMAKSTLDAGWAMLKTMLGQKSHQAGVVFEEVNEAYTTQTCSCCGVIPASSPKGRAGLRIREWTCSECGAVHDRDVNAARNILAAGHRRLAAGIPVL